VPGGFDIGPVSVRNRDADFGPVDLAAHENRLRRLPGVVRPPTDHSVLYGIDVPLELARPILVCEPSPRSAVVTENRLGEQSPENDIFIS
jgi:hypothetical protein